MDEERQRPRGRALLTVLAVAAAIAAVPAGVALAGSGDSGQASGTEGQTGTFEVQDQAPERGDGDRRDCPKDHQDGQGNQGGSADSTEL